MPDELSRDSVPPATTPPGPTQLTTDRAGSTNAAIRDLSKKQLAIALVIAALSDFVGAFVTLNPPLAWGLDLVTAILLFIVLGWRWLLLPGLILEAIPGIGVIPFWLLVVVAIAIWGTARPAVSKSRQP